MSLQLRARGSLPVPRLLRPTRRGLLPRPFFDAGCRAKFAYMENNPTHDSPLFFVGTWKITLLYCQVVDKGWVLFKRYGSGKRAWTFDDKKSYEHLRKKPDYVTDYGYIPDEKFLWIDQSDIADDGYINICVEDHYRVEIVSLKTVWLYPLEDVKNEPEDYRFKMKLIRE